MKKQAPSPANEDHKKEEPRTDQAKKVPTVKDSKDPKVITDGKDDKKGIRAEEPSSDKNNSKKNGKTDTDDKKKLDKNSKVEIKDEKLTKITKANDPVVKEPKKEEKPITVKEEPNKKGGRQSQQKDNRNTSLPKEVESKPKPQNQVPQKQSNQSPNKNVPPSQGVKINEIQSSQKETDVIQSSGLLKAYQSFLKSLCKQGLPSGDVFQFAAQHIQKYEKRRIAKSLKEKAEAQIRKKARPRLQQQPKDYEDDFDNS